MLVEQQRFKSVGGAQLKFLIHLDRLEGADLNANLAAHANRDINVENGRVKLRLADVIGLFIFALCDVNALGRTFLLTNLASDAAQSGRGINAIKDQERKVAGVFLKRQALVGVLD